MTDTTISLEVAEAETTSLKHVGTFDMHSVILGKNDIIDLWERGILSPLAYIHLAIEYDRKEKGEKFMLDLPNLITRWRGKTNPDSGAAKYLKPKQVLSAIATLEEKETLTMGMCQLSLLLL